MPGDGKEQIDDGKKEENNGAYIVVNIGSVEAPVLQYRVRETWR